MPLEEVAWFVGVGVGVVAEAERLMELRQGSREIEVHDLRLLRQIIEARSLR